MRHARPDYQPIQDPRGLIPADEPVFLVRGQDISGADTVRAWADLNDRNGGEAGASRLAREHADRMDEWPRKKLADLPATQAPREIRAGDVHALVRAAGEIEAILRTSPRFALASCGVVGAGSSHPVIRVSTCADGCTHRDDLPPSLVLSYLAWLRAGHEGLPYGWLTTIGHAASEE